MESGSQPEENVADRPSVLAITSGFARLGERERELLRREVFLVDQRRHDTESRLKALEEKAVRMKESENYRHAAVGRYGRVKRERQEEEDTSKKKLKVGSLVALPGSAETLEAADQEEEEKPTEPQGVPRPRRLLKIADTKRDRKLMGFVLGHLNKSKQESQTPAKSDVFVEKMRKIDQKLEDDRSQERAKAVAQVDEETAKQQELQNRLTKRYEQLQRAHTRALLEEREYFFSHFLETDTKPKLYFLPSHHTNETRKRVEERKAASTAKYQEFRKSLDALIADVEQNSIEKLLPSANKGKGAGKGMMPMRRPEPTPALMPPPPSAAPGARRQERDRDELEDRRQREHDASEEDRAEPVDAGGPDADAQMGTKVKEEGDHVEANAMDEDEDGGRRRKERSPGEVEEMAVEREREEEEERKREQEQEEEQEDEGQEEQHNEPEEQEQEADEGGVHVDATEEQQEGADGQEEADGGEGEGCEGEDGEAKMEQDEGEDEKPEAEDAMADEGDGTKAETEEQSENRTEDCTEDVEE